MSYRPGTTEIVSVPALGDPGARPSGMHVLGHPAVLFCAAPAVGVTRPSYRSNLCGVGLRR
jgi:hypothetical protein